MKNNTVNNFRAPLLSWDLFMIKYNSLMEEGEQYCASVSSIKEIAKSNKWDKKQTQEALKNLHKFVIVITDSSQKIEFTGRGFYEMTGYSFDEAKGRNPKFLQGTAVNINNTKTLNEQLSLNKPSEVILENYRKNGEMYLCKIVIKPIVNINKQLVNYIAYEEEIAA